MDDIKTILVKLDALSEKIDHQSVSLGTLTERMQEMSDRVLLLEERGKMPHENKSDLAKLQERLTQVEAQIGRWKGALAVIVPAAAFLGALAQTALEKVMM